MRALFILMPEGFRDEEFMIPKSRLESAGVSVTVAGLSMDEAHGMLGMRYRPDILVGEVDLFEFDAVVVPGGSGSPKYLWDNERVQSILKRAFDAGKVVAGICLSAAVLARAGVLAGRKATVFESPRAVELLKCHGASYVKGGVVVDGRVVTADGPASAERFADEILKLLR